MIIDTPYGKAAVPENYADDYKDKTDIELIEILLEQNKNFLDPVLVQICLDKNLLKRGEAVEDLEMELDYLKVQEYSNLKAENERLKEQLTDKDNELHASFVSNDKLCDKNHNLIHQLKEKDELLEKWQERAVVTNGALDVEGFNQILKANTHQVCEKIRNKFPISKDDIPDETTYFLHELLDQIEKGEQSNAENGD